MVNNLRELRFSGVNADCLLLACPCRLCLVSRKSLYCLELVTEPYKSETLLRMFYWQLPYHRRSYLKRHALQTFETVSMPLHLLLSHDPRAEPYLMMPRRVHYA